MRPLLRKMYKAAVDACHPARSVAAHLPDFPKGRLIVVGAGKAAAAMAKAVEDGYRAQGVSPARMAGLVIVPDGIDVQTQCIKGATARHPVPDERGVAATQRILDLVEGAEPEDLVLFLLSGGASSLLCAPADGIGLAEKQDITRQMFQRGAPIDDLNAVRICLSAVKGGRLAAFCAPAPAPVVTLAISDVVGDDPMVIGSGPTVRPHISEKRLARLWDRYDDVLKDVLGARAEPLWAAFRQWVSARRHEAAKDYRLIASPHMALKAAADCARSAGFRPVILGDDLIGEARQCAQDMAQLATRYDKAGEAVALISGGEVTVTFDKADAFPKGGPNREFALALALALEERPGIEALIADSDGVDGSALGDGPVAGAFIDRRTLARAEDAGLDAWAMLNGHASGAFFEMLGDEFRPGPTDTNVNDLRFILIEGQTAVDRAVS